MVLVCGPGPDRRYDCGTLRRPVRPVVPALGGEENKETDKVDKGERGGMIELRARLSSGVSGLEPCLRSVKEGIFTHAWAYRAVHIALASVDYNRDRFKFCLEITLRGGSKGRIESQGPSPRSASTLASPYHKSRPARGSRESFRSPAASNARNTALAVDGRCRFQQSTVDVSSWPTGSLEPRCNTWCRNVLADRAFLCSTSEPAGLRSAFAVIRSHTCRQPSQLGVAG